MAQHQHQQQDLDIDPGWYPGQPETAPADHVPTVLTKLQKWVGAAVLTSAGAGRPPLAPRPAPPLPHPPPPLTRRRRRWGDYQGVGDPVAPTRFLPMKTPLSEQILSQWALPCAPRHSLTVREMLASQAAAGRRIGLVLDLSNHECLYTGDMPPGLLYEHIYLVAKELPPLDYVQVGLAGWRGWRGWRG
jgi:hypothetical protein